MSGPWNCTSPTLRRIAVTGLGVISPCGGTLDQFWAQLTDAGARLPRTPADSPAGREDAGRPAAGFGTDAADQPRVRDAERPFGVAGFSGRIEDFPAAAAAIRTTLRKSLKLMNRETQMGVAAGQQALLDSGLQPHAPPDRIGVCFAAENVSIMPEDFAAGVRACRTDDGEFDLGRWGSNGIGEVAPLWMLKCLPNMPACHLGILHDLRGPVNTITQRDVGANLAVAEAARWIRHGDVNAVLVGAAGTLLPETSRRHATFENELAADAQAVCRPFDRRRSGPAPGEGAAALVLEDLDAAQARGARIYGELLGYAATSCVDRDALAGCRRALVETLQLLLARARLSPEDVGHIHAHGLGTAASDLAEAQALVDVFGPRLPDIPVLASKGRLAHAGAASGAQELVASLLALHHGRLFSPATTLDLDPQCPLRLASRDDPPGDVFINLNLFGRGTASAVILRRVEPGESAAREAAA